MSTILKALRRLEDEQDSEPTAPDVLRERILAEELAAQAAGSDPEDEAEARSAALLSFVKHRGPALATAFVLLGAALIVGISLGTPGSEPSTARQANGLSELDRQPIAAAGSHPAATPRQPAAVSARAEISAPSVIPDPTPRQLASSAPTSAERPRPIAAPAAEKALTSTPTAEIRAEATSASIAVRPAPPLPGPTKVSDLPVEIAHSAPKPTQKLPAKSLAKSEAESRPSRSPVETVRGEAPVADRPSPSTRLAKASPPAPAPVAQVDTVSASSRNREKSAESAAPEIARRMAPGDLPRIAEPAIPDLSVLRTAWHPQSERRSARIQLAKSEEVITLREGDAVGSLVVKEITPSSVLFAAGDVELRRRVGN